MLVLSRLLKWLKSQQLVIVFLIVGIANILWTIIINMNVVHVDGLYVVVVPAAAAMEPYKANSKPKTAISESGVDIIISGSITAPLMLQ